MKLKLFIFLIYFFITISSYGQTGFEPSISYKWTPESNLSLKTQGTNFNAPFLVNLKVFCDQLGKNALIYSSDSLYVGKGIFINRQNISIPSKLLDQLDSSFVFSIQYENVKTKKPIFINKLTIVKQLQKLPEVSSTDTSLFFRYRGNDKLSLKITVVKDSLNSEEIGLAFPFAKDTSFYYWDIIKNDPLSRRTLFIDFLNGNSIILSDTLFIENGRFSEIPYNTKLEEVLIDDPKRKKAIGFSGELYIENNAFSDVPEHSNGLQYPNTIFRSSNTISIYGIPFQLNAHHTTNDNIDPNYRNFFSFSLDVNSYRNQMKENLIADGLSNEYSISEIKDDLEKNRVSIDKMEQLKETLIRYPGEEIKIDSLLKDELEQLESSELKDTSQIAFIADSIRSSTDSISLDSNLNASKINEINSYVDRLESSNRYKEKLIAQKKVNPSSFDRSQFEAHKLYQKVQDKGMASLFLRFEKLEIGNFYQYANKYSIRDVEIIGLNAEFLIDPTNKISFLRGDINEFQAFNLDELQSDIRVTSVGLTNTQWKSFSPSIRVTEYVDKSIDNENGGASASNYVSSIGIQGEISSSVFYEGELNRSDVKLSSTVSEFDDFLKSTAIYGKVEIFPFDFLSLNVKYDRVGSSYQSDGVYFLIRDMQSYSVGSHIKLFKNKIYFKNDYTLISRNVEQESLTNDSRKLFFDLGSRFKRIPNFQIIHSPISVDIANKLDTSFSNLNAFSSVTIARVFYVKKVKRTILNTALIYSEILNDFFEGTNKQRGFQHFMGFANPNTQLTFTSSYSEIFEKIQFISTNFSQQINTWCRGSLYLAKNFQDDRYSEIARIKFDLKLGENLLFGIGGAALFEKNRKANYGSTISLRYLY